MSLLNVEHLTHGFGDRAIFDDVSFRLLKGEHIGLVGANGEGKSTFMNIITGKLMPDEGKIEWAKNIKIGYLDQHPVLEKGMTIANSLTHLQCSADLISLLGTKWSGTSAILSLSNTVLTVILSISWIATGDVISLPRTRSKSASINCPALTSERPACAARIFCVIVIPIIL